jgi:3-hydroxy-9,10-secoandrosta-1,3,5(10)-triene-9,17-dione monooxygenase
MLRRAEAMRPVLRQRQQECERLGRLPEQTHQEFLKAGFYRVLQPQSLGGYESSISDFARLLIEVSRGCVDSGWVLSIVACQPAAFLCLFSEEAQREVFGDGGDCRAILVAAVGGTAVPSDSGYRVQGTWDYCTGCDVATHMLAHAVVIDPATQVPCGTAFLLLDMADCTITDNWDVFGMQGTGSRRITVAETSLPAHRVLPLAPTALEQIGEYPGRALHANSLYHGYPLKSPEFALNAVAVGAAKGALDVYEAILREKKWAMPPFPGRFEMPELQQAFGEAQALVDTAEAAILAFAGRYTEACRRSHEEGAEFTVAEARRINRAGEQCVELAWQAVDLMFRTGGSSAAAKSSPLGRYFRSLAVIRTHIGTQRDHTSINVARLHFGLPATSPV